MSNPKRDRPAGAVVTCAYPACGKRFRQGRPWARYCSDRCRIYDHYLRRAMDVINRRGDKPAEKHS